MVVDLSAGADDRNVALVVGEGNIAICFQILLEISSQLQERYVVVVLLGDQFGEEIFFGRTVLAAIK